MGEQPRSPERPILNLVLTESDIEYLVAEGELELEQDTDTATPLLRLTRRIAEQYLARFASWSEAQEPPEIELAMQAAAEVDRLASTSGDEALRDVLATLPKPDTTPRGWWGALRGWVSRFADFLK